MIEFTLVQFVLGGAVLLVSGILIGVASVVVNVRRKPLWEDRDRDFSE